MLDDLRLALAIAGYLADTLRYWEAAEADERAMAPPAATVADDTAQAAMTGLASPL